MRQRRDLTESPESIPLPGVRPLSARRVLSRLTSSKSVRRRLVAAPVIVLLGWTGYVMAGRAMGWLHAQPEFTIPFAAVELVPDPPAAVRDGRETIFARVRERAKIDAPIRLLDQDLRELGLAFAKHSPWIAGVERVERVYPRRIVVRVAYREPVARLDLDEAQGRFVAIADDGVVIPGEDLKTLVAATLPRLKGLSPPPQDLPGHYLGADRDGNVPPEITSAVSLARFLHASDGAKAQTSRIASVNVIHRAGRLMVRTKQGMWVSWRNAPGEEAEDEPKAVEKLERLIRWEDAHRNEPFSELDYLDLSGNPARLTRSEKAKG